MKKVKEFLRKNSSTIGMILLGLGISGMAYSASYLGTKDAISDIAKDVSKSLKEQRDSAVEEESSEEGEA